jgi:hypothetical protein
MTSLIKLHKEPIMKENTNNTIEKVDLKNLSDDDKEKYAKITREKSAVVLDTFLRVTSAKNRDMLIAALADNVWGRTFGIPSKDLIRMIIMTKELNVYNQGKIDEDLMKEAIQPIITKTIKRMFKDEYAGLGGKRPVTQNDDEVDDEEKVYPPHKVVRCTNKKCQGIMKVTYVGEDGRTYKARPDSWEERFGVVGYQCTCSR